MLTARQLDALPDPIIALYEEYNQTVIRDIARRLAGLDFAKPTAAWQMQRLIESGKVYETALAELAHLSGKSEAALRTMFADAGVKALRFDDSVYRKAGLNPLPLHLSPAMAHVLAAGLRKTNGVAHNLTLTTAISGQQLFGHAADLAYLQVSSGAMSYTQAIRAAVISAADQGLSVIHYSGRKDQLDVAMRRAVLTGVSQTAGNLQIARADEMGCDLVETSAHTGARPEHVEWQGKVFSRSGNSADYPPFVASTGYGSAAGLCGVNCHHSFYPFFEGISEPANSQAQLDEMADKTVTYNGKDMPTYDALQQQRSIERKIRHWKREAGALDAAGLDSTQATAKVKEWQGHMRDFTRQTGLLRQSERESVYIPARPAGAAAAPAPAPLPPAPPAPPPPPAKPLYEFEETKSIKDASAFAHDKLGVDFADYTGADVQTANEWNRGLTDTFNRFPELKQNFTGVGTTQARYRAEYDEIFSEAMEGNKMYFDQLKLSPERREKYAASVARKYALRTPPRCYAYSVATSPRGRNGVFISGTRKFADIMRSIGRDVESGFHPAGTGTLKAIFDHEIGHQIDALLKLKYDPDFLKVCASLTSAEIKAGLSGYATTSRAELIAEAWAEYVNNPSPRPIAKQIGDLIMRKYATIKP